MGDPLRRREPQQIDVLVKQILSKYCAAAVELLFQERRNKETGLPETTKEPLALYISHSRSACQNTLQDISDVILSPADKPVSVIICNSKLRVSISFKVLLLIKLINDTMPTLIILPNDIGSRCMTQYDLAQPQYSNREHLIEVLKTDGENFLYTVDIPLSKFDNLLSREQLNDPTLQSNVLLKNTSWFVEIEGMHDTRTDALPSDDCTAITLSVAQDILARICIEHSLSFECIPDDF